MDSACIAILQHFCCANVGACVRAPELVNDADEGMKIQKSIGTKESSLSLENVQRQQDEDQDADYG